MLQILVNDETTHDVESSSVTARVAKALEDAGLSPSMVHVRAVADMTEHDNIIAWFQSVHSPGAGNVPS